ncbi:MAG: hypothetical protein IJE67_01230 [Peptococcaceae bacterium]|nr:hypothetical protein [Peptococcaceae bacterium]
MNNTKKSLLTSITALVVCFTMLVSSTFAWFTSTVTSSGNVVAAGNLKVELLHENAYTKSQAIAPVEVTEDADKTELKNKLFVDAAGNDMLWEPGAVTWENFTIRNAGDLALVYQFAISAANENFVVNADGTVTNYGLSQVLKVGLVPGGLTDKQIEKRENVIAAVAADNWKTVKNFVHEDRTALPAVDDANTADVDETERKVGVVVYWEPSGNDNNYNLNNGKSVTTSSAVGLDNALSIDLGIKVIATQAAYESDSFGNNYDAQAADDVFPKLMVNENVKATVEVDANNLVTGEVIIAGAQVKATVPAGVKVTGTELTMTVTELEATNENITIGDNEEGRSLDVHIEGVANDNTVPIIINLGAVMPIGLNMGNSTLYHVQGETPVLMTPAESADALTVHNTFYYNPADGNLTIALVNFSEIAVVSDIEKAWQGEFNYTWYDTSKSELTIANADQLAAFGAIVGGMAEGIEQDSFSGKTVKLAADINLGDSEAENNSEIIFYPIGYYNSEGTYEKTNTAITSGLRNFEGTFDGNGHTISNFYQNTWEMKGDHNWYDATLQYYRDGMGLFGKVYGGTVKNLTVNNFSSDGEIATTGTIAAYADGATFENIAITNCNPRVYNIGNGGIVGCVGWYAKEANLKTTFKNITVDNSNKISALWGSYDVACGGLVGQYYPTSGQTSAGSPKNAGIHFDNCHVSAIMDVYNDVCANYQYYAYRYTGMLIGSVRENVTIDGHVYPKMDGITAEGCTVHFGTWNDYYYCEIVDNTTASYTHDYQMSRLEEIKAIDGTNITYLDGTTGTVPTSGRANYVIVDYTKGHGTENATCYHFKDGAVWTHDMGGIQTGIDENGDGQDDLKEDKQHIYLEFNNLVTGYGWGVTTKGVGDMDGVEILDRKVANSVKKFEGKVNELANNKEYKLGDIFSFVDNGVELVPSGVTVAVTNLDENNPVSATIAYDEEKWENGKLTLNGTGNVQITIQDYYFCTPTTIEVTVADRQHEEKFDVVMNNGDFLHRVGNQNTVVLDSLFKAKEGATVGTVSVTVDNVAGNASGTHTPNATWTKGTIQFSGTGVVKVTITDNDYCTPTELYLEVVDAVNATTVTNATANNVVLLNDCGFSSLDVSGGYTLYGNGFTMTCGSDSAALDMGYSFVTLNNGTLDNVQIVCPNFDYAALYKSNLTSSDNRSETTDKTRYYNAKSGVMASGNSQILNSRISGGRAAVNVSGGNVVIDNSRIELGAVASVLVGAANSLTLRDVTLVQKPTASTYDSNKKLMGFSVLYLCDSEGKATPTTLEGSFVQQAWVNADDKQYVPSAGQDIVDGVMKETAFIHNINGNDSLNLGFAYMPEDAQKTVAAPDNITDNRTDKATIPYEMKDVKIQISILSTTVYVYSYKNTNGTADSFKTESEYEPNKYSDIITVNYSDTADGLTAGKSYGTDGWVYELNVDLDKLSGYALDFSKLSMTVNGKMVTDFKVDGSAKPASPVAVTAGGTTYILTATIDDKEYTATYKVTGTETSKESPSLVGTPSYGAGFGVANKYGGDWSAAAPVLDGITVKYWSVADSEYKEFALSSITFANTGKQNGTNNYWEYTHTNNDFTLKLTNTAVIHSSSGTYGMPVAGKDGKLYFTIASSGGFVSTGTTSRSITIAYEFTDNNGGDTLKFSHTWSIPYSKDEQYNYSSFTSDGTLTKLEAGSSSGGGGCVTPDTLITLADGTQKRVDTLTGDELLLVWNMETGKYEAAPIVFVDSEEESAYNVIHLNFSDGSEVKVIYEHGFFDLDLGEYVYITEANYADYIGHRFVAQGDIAQDTWEVVTLADAYVTTELTTAWSPVTFAHLCYYTNGVLSMPGGIDGLFNIFAVDTDSMAYDDVRMAQDIATYGLFTYEDFGGMIPEEAFEAFNGDILKVAIGKGMLTWDDIAYLAERYIPLM